MKSRPCTCKVYTYIDMVKQWWRQLLWHEQSVFFFEEQTLASTKMAVILLLLSFVSLCLDWLCSADPGKKQWHAGCCCIAGDKLHSVLFHMQVVQQQLCDSNKCSKHIYIQAYTNDLNRDLPMCAQSCISYWSIWQLFTSKNYYLNKISGLLRHSVQHNACIKPRSIHV